MTEHEEETYQPDQYTIQFDNIVTQTRAVITTPHHGLFNTSRSPLYSGSCSYYFSLYAYNMLITGLKNLEGSNNLGEYMGLIHDMRLPYCDVYITHGNMYNDSIRPEGWNSTSNQYIDKYHCVQWYFTVKKSEMRRFDVDYVANNAVVCQDPWKYRRELISRGYIEVSRSFSGLIRCPVMDVTHD